MNSRTREKLDKICGDLVRARGFCEAEGYVPHVAYVDQDDVDLELEPWRRDVWRGACFGPLQWAHGISRRHLALRWETATHFCLCLGHADHFTNHPAAWTEWMQTLYPERAALIEARRNDLWDKDIDAIVAALARGDAAALV